MDALILWVFDCSVNGAWWEHHASVNGGWSSQGRDNHGTILGQRRDNPCAIFVEFGSFYQKMLIFNSSSKPAPALVFNPRTWYKDSFYNRF